MTKEPNSAQMEKTGPAPAARSVYIIDDDSDMRKSLHFLLAASGITAWPFRAAADFFDQLEGLAPAPILLDIRMPDIDGLQALAILRERSVPWPVVVMTAHGDVKIAVRAMKLGVVEFLEKPFEPDLLDKVLEQIFSTFKQDESSFRSRDHARKLIAQLSKREREVVAILIEGELNKGVAHRLGLSSRTVEMHRRNALAKLGVRSIAEVIYLAASADVVAQSVELHRSS
jgi:two-component system response regulator FixJ